LTLAAAAFRIEIWTGGGMSARRLGLDLIASCAGGDPFRTIAAFRAQAGALGFAASFCGAWAGEQRSTFDRVFFSDWPPEALAQLAEGRLFAGDGLLEEARRRLMPFTWREAAAERRGKSAAHPGLNGQGWADGLIIPIHGPAGYQAVLGLASRQPVQLAPADRAVLHAMALALHECCRVATVPDTRTLTPREQECLRLVASGHSDRSIAGLLGVAPTTAHFHVEQAKKKLGVRSRALAVAMLLLRGEL
jgi:LuxR family quorum sensing-dependent transcriptional regulator